MKTLQYSKYLLLAILLTPGILNARLNDHNKIAKKNGSDMYTAQNNKETVKKLYEELLNNRKLEGLKNIISEDYAGFPGKKGLAGFEAPILQLIHAFPDVRWTIMELIAEGDKVMVKWEIEGTHVNQFQHIAPTGKKVKGTGMGIFDFRDGRIVNAQVITDRLGFLQELGALPADITALSNKKALSGQVHFIDKFSVPPAAQSEFYERMSINRSFIKKLPGFITDAAYEYTDEDGNLICVTVAQWESRDAFNKAREAVQAAYKKEGFDAAAMFKRLNITADRGVYTEVAPQ